MVRPCCAIRVVFDEKKFFSSAHHGLRTFPEKLPSHSSYISYPRRIQTSSDSMYSYTGMHPHSQMSRAIFCMIVYSLITYARIFLCIFPSSKVFSLEGHIGYQNENRLFYIYQWNCVLEIASLTESVIPTLPAPDVWSAAMST